MTATISTAQLRCAHQEDAARMASLFQEAYGDTSHPCKDEVLVRATFADSSYRWVVAEIGGVLIGCTATFTHEWNGIAEIGRTVTSRGFRKTGLGSTLVAYATEEVFRSGDVAFLYGEPRSAAMLSLLRQIHGDQLVLLGHDGGQNVAGGTREVHLNTAVMHALLVGDHPGSDVGDHAADQTPYAIAALIYLSNPNQPHRHALGYHDLLSAELHSGGDARDGEGGRR